MAAARLVALAGLAVQLGRLGQILGRALAGLVGLGQAEATRQGTQLAGPSRPGSPPWPDPWARRPPPRAGARGGRSPRPGRRRTPSGRATAALAESLASRPPSWYITPSAVQLGAMSASQAFWKNSAARPRSLGDSFPAWWRKPRSWQPSPTPPGARALEEQHRLRQVARRALARPVKPAQLETGLGHVALARLLEERGGLAGVLGNALALELQGAQGQAVGKGALVAGLLEGLRLGRIGGHGRTRPGHEANDQGHSHPQTPHAHGYLPSQDRSSLDGNAPAKHEEQPARTRGVAFVTTLRLHSAQPCCAADSCPGSPLWAVLASVVGAGPAAGRRPDRLLRNRGGTAHRCPLGAPRAGVAPRGLAPGRGTPVATPSPSGRSPSLSTRAIWPCVKNDLDLVEVNLAFAPVAGRLPRHPRALRPRRRSRDAPAPGRRRQPRGGAALRVPVLRPKLRPRLRELRRQPHLRRGRRRLHRTPGGPPRGRPPRIAPLLTDLDPSAGGAALDPVPGRPLRGDLARHPELREHDHEHDPGRALRRRPHRLRLRRRRTETPRRVSPASPPARGRAASWPWTS